MKPPTTSNSNSTPTRKSRIPTSPRSTRSNRSTRSLTRFGGSCSPKLLDFQGPALRTIELPIKRDVEGAIRVKSRKREKISIEILPNELITKILKLLPDSAGFPLDRFAGHCYYPPLEMLYVSRSFRLLGRETFFRNIRISEPRRLSRIYKQLKSSRDLGTLVRTLEINFDEELSFDFFSCTSEGDSTDNATSLVDYRVALRSIVIGLPLLQKLVLKSITPSAIFNEPTIGPMNYLRSYLYRSITSLTLIADFGRKLDGEELKICIFNLPSLENLIIQGYESDENLPLSLTLSDNKVSRALEPRLGLRVLKLIDSTFSKSDLDALFTFIRPTTLHILCISELHQSTNMPTLIALTSTENPNLENSTSLPFHVTTSLRILELELFNFGSPGSLSLDSSDSVDHLLSRLLKDSNLPALRVLKLGGTVVGTDESLASIPKSITKLKLKSCKITSRGLLGLIKANSSSIVTDGEEGRLKVLELYGGIGRSDWKVQESAWKHGITLRIDGVGW